MAGRAVDVGRGEVAQVGQRVTQGRHLPVEDGADPRRRVRCQHDVPEPVVAVDQRDLLRSGQVVREPLGELLLQRELAAAGDRGQAGEGRDLALQVTVGAAEVREPGLLQIHRVQVDEGVDKDLGGRAAVLVRGEEVRDGVDEDLALQHLHDVEGDAQDRLVVGGGEDLRYGQPHRRDALLHAGLAHHVVRGLRDGWARSAPQDELGVAAADLVGDVGLAVADPPPGQRAAAQSLRVEVGLDAVEDEERGHREGVGLGGGADDLGTVGFREEAVVGSGSGRCGVSGHAVPCSSDWVRRRRGSAATSARARGVRPRRRN